MTVNKDSVLAWLNEQNLSREYLAEQCGVGINAVNNWLGKNSKRNIPAKAVLIIENLMRLSAEEHEAQEAIPQNLVLEFSKEEFDHLCLSAAEAGEVPRKWAKQVILNAANRINTGISYLEPIERVEGAEHADSSALTHVAESHSSVYDQEYNKERDSEKDTAEIYALPFVGAAAAGEPVEAPYDGETVIVENLYDAYHYVAEVNGESMQPTLMDGERIIFETKDKFSPANGKICIIQDAHGNSIKRYNRKKNAYVSDNPDYPDFTPVGDVKLLGYYVEKL